MYGCWNWLLPVAIIDSRAGFSLSTRAGLEPETGRFLLFSSCLRSFTFIPSSLFNKLVALFTSCGVRIRDLVGVLALGVVERGVPGMLFDGDVNMLDAWLEEAPLIYPLLDRFPETVEALPEVSPLLGAGSRICEN